MMFSNLIVDITISRRSFVFSQSCVEVSASLSTVNTTNSYGVASFRCCRRNCDAKHRGTALRTCRQAIPLWLRYVDDTFTAVHKDEIDEFHDHLNEQNADIQFTREVEEGGKLPFPDCLVSRDENTLRTTVYRKPTHTDRLLDELSYNPTSHKATTIKTLTRRAQLVCNTPDSLSDENKYLRRVFDKNNYNDDVIRRNAHQPTGTTETNANSTPTVRLQRLYRTSRARPKPSRGSLTT